MTLWIALGIAVVLGLVGMLAVFAVLAGEIADGLEPDQSRHQDREG